MGMPVKVLLLEDDPGTAQSVCRGLESTGFETAHAPDVETGLAVLSGGPVDAAVLDVMVPGGGGYVVLERIRATSSHVPVLMLTARDGIEDRVEGLDRGADDYLIKPFAFAELLARLRSLLRRPPQRIETIRVAALELDPIRRSTSCGNTRVDLTRIEFDLLFYLMERRGEVLNRKLLLERVWGYRFDPGTNVVDVHVNRLRRKLADAGQADIVRTVRGVGYVVD